MLIKEYRIPLPVTVEEYRIAQLYMIAKKSREESKGAGSGVEILVNEPYEDGPGGQGQYTHKIYHVGSHLPGWFKSLLPKSALTVEEEAWNAYPYTKTRYTCPFVEKFSLEIETYYCDDDGHQENVFNLSASEMRNRLADLIDVVKDQLYGADYNKDEDPKFYMSQKTGRGPLQDNWIEEYWKECQGKKMPLPNGKAIMCAYKLCRVEFRYWGMQSKIEKFIHDVALRKTMLRAHRQAWAWQDEWYGLTMDDIRQIERQTQEALKRKMGGEADEESTNNGLTGHHSPGDAKTLAATMSSIEKSDREVNQGAISPVTEERDSISDLVTEKRHPKIERSPDRLRRSVQMANKPQDLSLNLNESGGVSYGVAHEGDGRRKLWSRSSSRGTLNSPDSLSGKSFDFHMANWRMESIVRDSDTESDDEFFDCQEDVEDAVSLTKWSSMDLLPHDEAETPAALAEDKQVDSIFSQSYIQRMTSVREKNKNLQASTRSSLDTSLPPSPTLSPSHHSCSTTVLFVVFHAGSVLDANVDPTARKSDITTFKGAFESVMRQHYPSMVGRVAIRLISCPSICTEALGVLSSLSPYSFDVSPSTVDSTHVTNDSIPIGVIPLFAISNPDYQDAVTRVVTTGNNIYHDFLKSEEGQGFNGQVIFIGDSVGSILAYDALVRTTQAQQLHLEAEPPSPDETESKTIKKVLEVNTGNHESDPNHSRHLSTTHNPRRRSSSSSDSHHNLPKYEFEVSEFFMFGSPLPILLAYRKVLSSTDKNAPIPRPACHQVYNLFHPTDPLAVRLEPLLSARFSMLPPVNVSRYQKYPLGDGQPCHLLEFIQANPQLFADGLGPLPPTPSASFRRMSEISIQSTISGVMDSLPLHTINALTHKWWGSKRLDFALYCPEGLANFPAHALPHLFHASYWESSDVIAFILRQIGRADNAPHMGHEDKDMVAFSPNQPREKWMKKRTSVKLKVRMKFGSENVSANHRANDVIVREGAPQVLTARFMYGPLDMVALTGEKVDIHVMKDPPAGEWMILATEVTDKTGRIMYSIPEDKALGYGMYPIKMVVRGDHTLVDFYMAVVPPKTECIVFSIDGSFTASMSVTGKDPKVRAGAVDVVRHWQELGFVIIYVTGRPDMQQQRVVSWLAQHNFPHGLVSFADGLSTDPLGHKADYLRTLVQSHGLLIHAAYGSSKDIGVYTSVGLKPDQIFIVGKVSKKQQSQAQVLQEGYAAHLGILSAHGGSRPAQGNARMVIPRGYFGLPGQSSSLRRRRSAKRTTSYPLTGHALTTEGIMTRGMSPHQPRLSTLL